MKTIDERTNSFFIDTIKKMCKSLHVTPLNERIVKQVVASSGSVGANFQEASSAMSKKDFVKCLKISRKEAKECILWFNGLKETDSSKGLEIDRLIGEAKEISYILTSIITKTEK